MNAQTAPISGANTITKLLLKDHLGSMVAEVTITGSVVAGQVVAGSVAIIASGVNVHGFGPWGNARNAASPLNGDSRGFTGHEHLADLGLIHMNGRIYDPVIGRFLQADPIIQAPHNAQSHNRYSYVMNNPLSFTDPSGFSSWTRFRDRILKPVIGLVVGWYLGPLIGNWLQGVFFSLANSCTQLAVSAANFTGAVSGGFAAGGISGGNTQSALQGAFTAGLFFGAGSLADAASSAGMSGFGDGGVGRAALHAAVGCASGAAAGGSCGRGAASAGFAEFAGSRVGGKFSEWFGKNDFSEISARALVGGIASRIGGGRFENGALTAAFGYLYNCKYHQCGSSPEENGPPEGRTTEIEPNWEHTKEFAYRASLVSLPFGGFAFNGIVMTRLTTLHHFTSYEAAAAIYSSGSLQWATNALYGAGAYATAFNSRTWATASFAANTATAIPLPVTNLIIHPTFWPGTFRITSGVAGAIQVVPK